MTAFPDHWIIKDSSPDSIEAWSSFRLPFEPKGEKLSFRNTLREKIKKLKAKTPGMTLHAEYINTNLPSNCDVENILFYNIGPGHFSSIGCEHLFFEYGKSSPPPASDDKPYEHYIHYTVAQSEESLNCWRKTSLNKTLTTPDIKSFNKPEFVWAGIQKHIDSIGIENTLYIEGEFFLELTVNSPLSHKVNIYSLLKPLFDGVISSFQYSESCLDEVIINEVALILKEDPEIIKRWIQRPAFAVISDICPVKKQGNRIFWHPFDHLCIAGSVKTVNRSDIEDMILEINVFPVKKIM